MNKKNYVAMLSIIVLLIAVTLFLSPVNREPLKKEYGNSNISNWQYMPENKRLDKVQPADFDTFRSNLGAWTSVTMLDSRDIKDVDIFWLRGKLPDEFSIYSPALLLNFDFPVEVYVDGYMIYSYGRMDDRNRVLSFKHLVTLHEEYKGKMIYFRYPKIKGLTVEGIRYLTAWDLVAGSVEAKTMVEKEIMALVLCISGIFIGLCLMIIAGYQRRTHRYEAQLMTSAGAFVLMTSLNILSILYSFTSAINQPVFIFFMDYITYFHIPYTAGSFVAGIIKNGPKRQIKLVNKLFVFYMFFILLLSLIPGFDISRADYVFNISFLIYSLVLVYLVLKEYKSGNRDMRVIIIGLLCIGATGVLDIMRELRLTSFNESFSYYGIFILSICMVCFFGLRYSRLYMDVRAANIQLTKSKAIIEEINRTLDRKVIEKTSAIKSLFDNAEQGFLSIRKDLLVESEYSHKCRQIFGSNINGRSLPELLCNGNAEQLEFMTNLLKRVFDLQQAKDEERREVYFSLLPTELAVNGRKINVAYKLIDKHDEAAELKCMVILTDITEKHLLEQKLEQEQAVLKMGIKVVANHNEFVNAICDYKDFCSNRIKELLSSDIELEGKYAELFRSVHTFKGTFAQFEMNNTAGKLHQFETIIEQYRKAGYREAELEDIVNSSKPEVWLDEDVEILRRVLGDRYLRLDKLVVAEESKLKDIEDRILAFFSCDEGRELVRELRKLRYRSLKEMLQYYPEYCMRLSERLEKPINEFAIEGSEIRVDPDKYKGLCKVLVHLFRNAIDHGIEPSEKRTESGKSEIGNITCSIRADGGIIEISVCDDGAGIDIERIREKAGLQLHLSAEEAAAAGEEIIGVLFEDGFTTADKVTELSGRGVGLPAIKAEVERLGGKIEVKSEKGQGTCINIYIPLME